MDMHSGRSTWSTRSDVENWNPARLLGGGREVADPQPSPTPLIRPIASRSMRT